MIKCDNCGSSGWVCERHENKAGFCSGTDDDCQCGAPAMPCIKCNFSNYDCPPRMPDGFEEIEMRVNSYD